MSCNLLIVPTLQSPDEPGSHNNGMLNPSKLKYKDIYIQEELFYDKGVSQLWLQQMTSSTLGLLN